MTLTTPVGQHQMFSRAVSQTLYAVISAAKSSSRLIVVRDRHSCLSGTDRSVCATSQSHSQSQHSVSGGQRIEIRNAIEDIAARKDMLSIQKIVDLQSNPSVVRRRVDDEKRRCDERVVLGIVQIGLADITSDRAEAQTRGWCVLDGRTENH